jgi:hypothetical protein
MSECRTTCDCWTSAHVCYPACLPATWHCSCHPSLLTNCLPSCCASPTASPCPLSCGTFDVGGTGSFGDTGKPRFGCNGSLRWELPPCTSLGPQCVDGYEAAIDLATGAFLPENPFQSLVAK